MDRFIETETYASQLTHSYLKSNMDRFIDALALYHFTTLKI